MQSEQSENASTFSMDAQFEVHTKKIAQLTEDNSNFKAEIAAL